VAALVTVLAVSPLAWAQHTQGKINVTVLDPQKAVVPGAKLELTDLATGQVRTAETQSGGTYSFVNLSAGKYKLAVSSSGFRQAVYEVVVATSKVTDVEATLQVGEVTQVVEVGAVVPVIDTTSNAIGMNVNMRHIENLPIIGRDITQLARLSPGYSGVQGTNTGTWNGLPSIAQGNNIDGVIASPSRMKFGGNAQAAVSPRLENIEEMTVSTDQLDVNQGFGTSSMQLNYVTRRGGTDYHGRLYWDHRNSALNANSWSNNATGQVKSHRLRNEFGGSVGGPVWPAWKDKLFFFFSLSSTRQPGSTPRSSALLNTAAQAGDFSYGTQTIDLFQVAQAYNTSTGTTLPTAVNSIIANEMSRINQSLSSGTISTVDVNRNNITWLDLQPTVEWYPTFRIDYSPIHAFRINFSYNKTLQTQDRVNQPYFPGADFSSTSGGNKFLHYTGALGIEWTVSPTLINSFRAGYLSYNQQFVYDSPKEYLNNPVSVGWPLGLRSTMTYNLPVTTYYPVVSFSDTLTWQKSSHTMNFGMSFYRETNRYFNPPEGIAFTDLDLVTGDPALDAFINVGAAGCAPSVPGTPCYQPLPGASTAEQGQAQDLYALLTGRVSNVLVRYPYDASSGQYLTAPGGAFNLKERATAWGLFFQDSWRLKPNLTLNYGLRLDFTGDARDLNRAYHNADESSLYGPSGIGNLFMPGTLTGNMNPTLEEREHVYDGWTSPQPNLGIAWVPRFGNGFLGRLTGNDDLVIRASISLRSFTVPYQYFWNNASNYGGFFYQFATLQPTCSATPCPTGSYGPGSVSLGQTFPAYLTSPASYQAVAPASQFTFTNGQFNNGINGFADDISQPYTLGWTVGIQRKFGPSRALEIRYSANTTKNQWISYNLNEVNVFENGFLQEFNNARNNLAINGNSFANLNPTGGTVPVPILTAAFTGSQTGSQTNSNFASGTFINLLNTGAVGSFANTLSGVSGTPYFCNLVGTAFAPCVNNVNYRGPDGILGTPDDAGGGFPINFFQANPYGARIPVTMMNDDGYSNYNSLQIDFRQQLWHGLQFDANYTWSHTLGVSTPNDWTGSFTQFTLRDLKHSYGPTLFDLRHVMHVAATYDLPFGKGKQFANQGGVLDKIVGGWTVGTIMTYQTGFPFRVNGGYLTFNNLADGGVILNGVSASELQSAVGVFRFPGTPRVSLIDPQYLNTSTSASGQTIFNSANLSLISANTTPGEFAPPLYLNGPHGFYDDISISKEIPITERWRFSLQALFINAFNHPVFGQTTNAGVGGNIRGSNWATAGGPTNNPDGFGRQIEFRLNISF
jgi:hypothetical protein